MHQQVGNAEHRIAVRFADIDKHLLAALLDDNAVQRQRNRNPLILLDAAVVMRIQIRQILILIQRVLLHVDARRVDVRAEDIHARVQRLLAQHEEHEALPHPVDVNARAGGELSALANSSHQILKAALLRHLYRIIDALALGLAVVNKIAVSLGKRFNLAVVLCVSRPRIFSFHRIFLFPASFFELRLAGVKTPFSLAL